LVSCIVRAPRAAAVSNRISSNSDRREGELHLLAGVVRDELGAGLMHADFVNAGAQAQPVEDLGIQRQQALADMKARMALLLDQQHVMPPFGQQRRRGAAGGAAADHQDVARLRIVAHAMPPLIEMVWPVI
jgi:hypothetical protein